MDIVDALDSNEQFEIYHVGIIVGPGYEADSLKIEGGSKALRRILNGKDSTEVVKWIVRKGSHTEAGWECDSIRELNFTLTQLYI